MTDTVKLVKNSTQENKLNFFKAEAERMWNIKYKGEKVTLPINFIALRRDGMLKKHINRIKKYFTSKNGEYKNNVTYYYYQDGEKLEIFLEESDGIFDWKQNFMAFGFKVKIGFDYRRYHLGFYATSLTVFKDLIKRDLLTEETLVEIYGYSHGAGAAPSLFSMIRHNSVASVINTVKKFEPPRDILYPNHWVKQECQDHINFIQGVDVVTKVPWWMRSLGIVIKIKGQKLPWYKGLLKSVFDHDIFWTDERRNNEY